MCVFLFLKMVAAQHVSPTEDKFVTYLWAIMTYQLKSNALLKNDNRKPQISLSKDGHTSGLSADHFFIQVTSLEIEAWQMDDSGSQGLQWETLRAILGDSVELPHCTCDPFWV